MKPEDLKRAEVRYQQASAAAEKLREQRNQLVRQALAEGWTHARIAEITGLSRGRISQFQSKRPSDGANVLGPDTEE